MSGFYVTNPGGKVQQVSEESAPGLLAKKGWRASTQDELVAYHKESMSPEDDVPTNDSGAIAADVAGTIPDMKEGETDEAFLGRLSEEQLRVIAAGMEVAVAEPFDRLALTAALLAKKSEAAAAAKATR